MNFKKKVSGSWVDAPYYLRGTDTDTITSLPTIIYADGQSASAVIKGNMTQSGAPTPASPIYPSETGDKTANLFDKDNATVKTLYIDSLFGTFRTSSNAKTVTIPCKPNTTYTISKMLSSRFSVAYSAQIPVTGNAANGTIDNHTGTTITITTDNNAAYLSMFIYNLAYDTTITFEEIESTVMVVEGSTAPSSYIPWGYKIPILSGGTTTPVYLGEVQSTRNIYCMRLLNPSSVTTTSRGYYRLQFSIADHRAPAYTSGGGVCNITTWDGNYDNIGFVANNLTLYITQTISEWETLEGAKTWLNNNPVYVWYILLNAETGIVNEPIRKIGDYADSISNVTQIPTTAGSQTFDVDTTLKPSEVQLAYHGWHEHSDTVFSNP